MTTFCSIKKQMTMMMMMTMLSIRPQILWLFLHVEVCIYLFSGTIFYRFTFLSNLPTDVVLLKTEQQEHRQLWIVQISRRPTAASSVEQ